MVVGLDDAVGDEVIGVGVAGWAGHGGCFPRQVVVSTRLHFTIYRKKVNVDKGLGFYVNIYGNLILCVTLCEVFLRRGGNHPMMKFFCVWVGSQKVSH